MKVASVRIDFYWSETTKQWTAVAQHPGGWRMSRKIDSAVPLDSVNTRLLMSKIKSEMEALLPVG